MVGVGAVALYHTDHRKITDHYDTRTSAKEVEAVKLLIEKINVVNVLNRQPYFHTMALQCDIQLPISAVKDFRFLIQQTIAEASPHSGGKLWFHCFLL